MLDLLFIALFQAAAGAPQASAPAETAAVEEPADEDVAADESADGVKADEEPDVICRNVRMTGSYVSRQVCTSRVDRMRMQNDNERTVRWMDRPIRIPGSGPDLQ